MMERRLVLDASALLGQDLDLSGGGFVLCEEVRAEIIDERASLALEAALNEKDVEIVSPSDDSIRKVRAAAMDTGDIVDLSDADITSLALAQMFSIPIQTEDYAMQNVAKSMGIKWISARQKGITRLIKWGYRCSGCRKQMDGPGECGVCGHSAERKAKRG